MKQDVLKMDPAQGGAAPEKTGRRFSFIAILFSVLVALVLWFYVQEAEAPDYKKTFTDVAVRCNPFPLRSP